MNKLILLVCTVLMAGCTATTKEELTESGLKRSNFQTEVNGEKTDLFVLKNKNKMEVCVTNFGGRIVSVMVPDKDGNMKDVVLGFDSIYRTTSNIRLISEQVSDDMPIVLTRDASHWMVWNINCRKITTAIACTAVRKLSSIVCTKGYRRATRNCN